MGGTPLQSFRVFVFLFFLRWSLAMWPELDLNLQPPALPPLMLGLAIILAPGQTWL